MIIVEPESVYKTRRKSCEEITKVLDDAYEKCLRDEDYATKKTPWHQENITANPLMKSVKVSVTPEAQKVIDKNLSKIRVHWGPLDENPTE